MSRTSAPSAFDSLISYNLSVRRKNLGISMKYISENVSPPVSISCVQGWETYRWRIPTEYLLQIAELLNCNILDLLMINSSDLPDGVLKNQLNKLGEIRRHYDNRKTSKPSGKGRHYLKGVD